MVILGLVCIFVLKDINLRVVEFCRQNNFTVDVQRGEELIDCSIYAGLEKEITSDGRYSCSFIQTINGECKYKCIKSCEIQNRIANGRICLC